MALTKGYQSLRERTAAKHAAKAGNVYGFLTVTGFAGRDKYGHPLFSAVCVCGESVKKDVYAMQGGHIISCGCKRSEAARRNGKISALKAKSPRDSARSMVFETYRRIARDRGLVWGLTDSRADELFAGECFYCGAPPENMRSATRKSGERGEFFYNGIDRIDNNLGYLSDNCVSCCLRCNVAKNKHSLADFISWVSVVSKRMGALTQGASECAA